MGMFSAATFEIETGGFVFRIAHSTSITGAQGLSAPSSVSNIWIGAPGMMVEMACL
jgi:hypothetical protein